MKYFILILTLCSATAFSKGVIDFNKELNQNIEQTLKDNPEVYETRKINRGPASVFPAEVEEFEKRREDEAQKLNSIEPQESGRKDW